MGKKRVEICIVSGRGLHRGCLWKVQWYAVAWVDPSDKYCTGVEGRPVWRTKFSAVVDAECALHVEVYSRDPLFLRDKLHGSARVPVREFVSVGDGRIKDHFGSFQLRGGGKAKPKPRGFVDVSVRAEDLDGDDAAAPAPAAAGVAASNSDVINLAAAPPVPPVQARQPFQLPQQPFQLLQQQQPPLTHFSYSNTATPYPSNYNNNNNPSLGGPSYPPTAYSSYSSCPPPPMVDSASTSYLNLPPSTAGGGGRSAPASASVSVRPAFAVGVGAGALTAGALIFGDDSMSSAGLHFIN